MIPKTLRGQLPEILVGRHIISFITDHCRPTDDCFFFYEFEANGGLCFNICAELSVTHMFLRKLLYFKTAVDPFNTKLWDFAIYSVVFLFILVIFRNYKN